MITLERSIEWGVAERALAEEEASGDRWLLQATRAGVLIGVVDGLGHGSPAAEAAGRACEALVQHAEEPLDILMGRCHAALGPTRGAVMSLARLDPSARALAWLGVGNVEGLIWNPGAPPEGPTRLLTRGGVVGSLLPRLVVDSVSVFPGSTLVFCTDGVQPTFADTPPLPAMTPQQAADRILAEHGKPSDDALVLVVRFRSLL